VTPMSHEIARHYRAWIVKHAGPGGDYLVHLIRDGAEASLCGLPRSTLESGGIACDRVCPICIEWLPRRESAKIPKASR
jgi:hypothetical protein